jgi:dipeptidyl aminopeptidase/acylaminoacyl peptidase
VTWANLRRRPGPALAALSAPPILFALGGLACSGTLPPLRGEIQVGAESYAVVAAGANAGSADLYAVRASGGSVIPITFSSVGEMRPVLSPDGRRLAFLRGRLVGDSVPGSVWIMDLLTGGEREVRLPKQAGPPSRAGWSRDGAELTVAAGTALYRSRLADSPSHDAVPVPPAEHARADSTLAVLLGSPVFARVVPCAEPDALCVATDSGTGPLAEHAHDATRWGRDSVAFLTDDRIEVRPLGPGKARAIEWSEGPGKALALTAYVPEGRNDGRTDGPGD